jgi:hypothetical protein
MPSALEIAGSRSVKQTHCRSERRIDKQAHAGISQFSSVTYPDAPDTFYAFRKQDGIIKVIVDTTTTIYADNQNGTKTTIWTKTVVAG